MLGSSNNSDRARYIERLKVDIKWNALLDILSRVNKAHLNWKFVDCNELMNEK